MNVDPSQPRRNLCILVSGHRCLLHRHRYYLASSHHYRHCHLAAIIFIFEEKKKKKKKKKPQPPLLPLLPANPPTAAASRSRDHHCCHCCPANIHHRRCCPHPASDLSSSLPHLTRVRRTTGVISQLANHPIASSIVGNIALVHHRAATPLGSQPQLSVSAAPPCSGYRNGASSVAAAPRRSQPADHPIAASTIGDTTLVCHCATPILGRSCSHRLPQPLLAIVAETELPLLPQPLVDRSRDPRCLLLHRRRCFPATRPSPLLLLSHQPPLLVVTFPSHNDRNIALYPISNRATTASFASS